MAGSWFSSWSGYYLCRFICIWGNCRRNNKAYNSPKVHPNWAPRRAGRVEWPLTCRGRIGERAIIRLKAAERLRLNNRQPLINCRFTVCKTARFVIGTQILMKEGLYRDHRRPKRHERLSMSFINKKRLITKPNLSDKVPNSGLGPKWDHRAPDIGKLGLRWSRIHQYIV